MPIYEGSWNVTAAIEAGHWTKTEAGVEVGGVGAGWSGGPKVMFLPAPACTPEGFTTLITLLLVLHQTQRQTAGYIIVRDHHPSSGLWLLLGKWGLADIG